MSLEVNLNDNESTEYVDNVLRQPQVVQVRADVHAVNNVDELECEPMFENDRRKRRRVNNVCGNDSNVFREQQIGINKFNNSADIIEGITVLESSIQNVTNGQNSPRSDRENVNKDADVNDMFSLLIKQVSDNMQSLGERLTTRIDSLERNFARTIADMIDMKIKERLDEVKCGFQDEILDLREEIGSFKSRLDTMHTRQQNVEMENSLIIRNLPERRGENVVSKVNGLLRDGLKLKNIAVESAERKPSWSENRDGVIRFTCRNADDKHRILKSKRLLGQSRNFRNVYIQIDLSSDQRVANANMRTLIKALGNDNLKLKGARLVLDEDQHRLGHDRGARGSDKPKQSHVDYGSFSSNQRNRSSSRRRSMNTNNESAAWDSGSGHGRTRQEGKGRRSENTSSNGNYSKEPGASHTTVSDKRKH